MNRARQIVLGQQFLALHQHPGMVVLRNAWDVAIATTSAGIGYTAGYPVGEAMPLDTMLGDVARMADRVDIPLSADMEAGYGIAGAEVASTVRQTIAAGAVGINIEDTDHRTPGTLFDFDLAAELRDDGTFNFTKGILSHAALNDTMSDE